MPEIHLKQTDFVFFKNLWKLYRRQNIKIISSHSLCNRRGKFEGKQRGAHQWFVLAAVTKYARLSISTN